ncbi:hypothetical protein A9179_12275 [Pseudomonas alcaligenes]|uniref:Lipoprotein n=1 Tax=Aquipseudomonas alcaligenes TaxID=43263 RepID=A0ABR7S0F5_AQUAC|nr:hypothetical protein [Pseudomonas alcaligenes]MBC9251052.1 hypothetical protein [Pseudomonas alcaligenes]
MFSTITRIALALMLLNTAGCIYYEDDYGRYGHDHDRYEHSRYGDRDCDDRDYGRHGCRHGENDQGENEQD